MAKKKIKPQKKINKRSLALVKVNEARKHLVVERKKALMEALGQTEQLRVREIASLLNVSKRTAYRLLSESEAWQAYIEKRKKTLDITTLEVMKKLLEVARNGRFSPTQAVISYGILHDKTIGSEKPLATFNLPDRQIIVTYPNFKPPKESN